MRLQMFSVLIALGSGVTRSACYRTGGQRLLPDSACYRTDPKCLLPDSRRHYDDVKTRTSGNPHASPVMAASGCFGVSCVQGNDSNKLSLPAFNSVLVTQAMFVNGGLIGTLYALITLSGHRAALKVRTRDVGREWRCPAFVSEFL